MTPQEYGQIMAANGRLGGIAKAKNNAKRIHDDFIKNSQRVFDFSIANPKARQTDIAKALKLSQSFVSEVMTDSLKFLRLQALLGKKLSSQQVELWKLELQHLEMVIKPRKKASAL